MCIRDKGDVQGGGHLFQYVQRPLDLLGPVLADDAEPEPGPVLGHGGENGRGNEHAPAAHFVAQGEGVLVPAHHHGQNGGLARQTDVEAVLFGACLLYTSRCV